MRKTKIICTIGPATDDKKILKELINSGMDTARVNFSHGTHEEQLRRVNMLKEVRAELGTYVALLADTKGPELRLGNFPAGEVELKSGQTFTLCTDECDGDSERSFITFRDLPQDVSRGERILLDDGLIEMRVESCTNTEVVCTVLNDGAISSHKGVNVPGVTLSMPFISSRDRSDLRFAVENDFDYIASSFTRTATDVAQLKDELDRLNANHIKVIAKIENAEGVANVEEIINVADGIMVARGDLGVEVPLEDIPSIQKKLIKIAYRQGKPVVTATQMLDSMMHNPRPTRAEATDIANAIYDGTSAIMLSGETAAGQYPIESVKTMAKIADRTERDIHYKKRFSQRQENDLYNVTHAISHATVSAAHDLDAVAIITVTKSGGTARMISKYRPACAIIGCCTSDLVARQINLSWGVTPVLVAEQTSTDDLFYHAVRAAEASGAVNDGDLVVITAGVPLGVSGSTNMMKVHVVGDEREPVSSSKK